MTSLFLLVNINRIIMKKILFTLLLFSVFSQIEAQQLLTERLQRKLNNLNQFDELVSIRIEMLNKVDAFEMHKKCCFDVRLRCTFITLRDRDIIIGRVFEVS